MKTENWKENSGFKTHKEPQGSPRVDGSNNLGYIGDSRLKLI